MNTDLGLILILLIVLLISMSVHEMMHAFVADWVGDDTARIMGRVSLNPLKHIDPVLTVAVPLFLLISGYPLFGMAKPVQVDFNRLRYGEYGGAIVGMVGPLTNLTIAVLAALVFNYLNPASMSDTTYSIIKLTIELNVGMFIFNSIPLPPLDGSRLLYAFAPQGLREFMISIERMGLALVIVLVLALFVFGNPITNLYIRLIHVLAPGLSL